LHLTLADGFEKDLFVDKESFLIVGDRRSAPIYAFGEPVRSENRIGNYRAVNGVLYPFLFVEAEIATGKELNRLTIQSMINPKLDYSRTPLQQFLEQLYMERTDPVAVMNTYREFRLATPGLDTREAVEFIGYQMAKMSDFNGAVALLQANAADYPKFASPQYGLGRAHKAAGDMKNARIAFQRALQIDPAFKKVTEGLNALR
jgi:tetratricopeptide (TPR) repeat protein